MTTGFVRAMIVIPVAKRAIKVAKRAIKDANLAATPGVHGQALLVKSPPAVQTLKANSQVEKAKVTLPGHREIADSNGLDLVIDARVLPMGVHLATRHVVLLIVSHQVIVSHGANGLDLVIAGAMAEGHVSDQSHHSVITHHVVSVQRLVIDRRAQKVIGHHVVSVRHSLIDRRVRIAHVLTGTAHPGTLKAEKNILRGRLVNIRLNALALGRDRDWETLQGLALVKGHASEQDPHQVIDGPALKGAASAIDRQEVNVWRAATVHHAAPAKDEVLVIARHAVIARNGVTVRREVIVHHAAPAKDEVLEIGRHAAIAREEVTVPHEVIVRHAVPAKDEVLVIVRHAVNARKEVTVAREVIVRHEVKDEVLVIARHAAQNVPGASALIPEVHGATPDPSTLDCLRLNR
jgi:hypothetical protein